MINLYPSEEVLQYTNIVTTVIPNFHKISEQIEEAYQWFESKGLMNKQQTALYSGHTPFISHRMTELLRPVHDEFKEHAKQFFLKQRYEYGLNEYVECSEMWIAKYKEGSHAETHSHYPFHMAMTYYYDVKDPRPIQFEVYDPRFGGMTLKEIVPTEGMLIMFDGRLRHRVLPCRGDRTCVASNWFYDLKRHTENGWDEELYEGDKYDFDPKDLIDYEVKVERDFKKRQYEY